MTRKFLFVCILIVSLAAFSGAQAQEAPVGIDTICGEDALKITALDSLPEDETTLALDTLLRQFVTLPTDELPAPTVAISKPPAPGAVIYVNSPDGTYFRSIGVGDIESCAPINPDTPFPIGSNTKMFTAATIYLLQEDGLLATSDLVSKYLPDEIALWEGAESITIDMLLGHTSGLPDYLNSHAEGTLGGHFDAGDWGILEQAFSPEELVTMSSVEPLLFTPGAEGMWSYSNTGYIMLGQIIEAVTGERYVDVVKARIVDPLGMENTWLVEGAPPAELGLVGQYLINPFTINTGNWNFSQAWSAGDIVSTPEDMATFLRAYYSGSLFQNPDTLAAVLTRAAQGAEGESDQYYYIHGGYYKGGLLGHGGQTLGTESDVGYDPESGTVIVTWANSSDTFEVAGSMLVGHIVGLTPSLDEILLNLSRGTSSIPKGSIEDIIDVPLTTTGVYIGSTGENKTAAEGSTYSITFGADGTMSIVADCNTVTATYTGEGDSFDITLGASTLVACPPESIADDFLAVLDAASSIGIISGNGIYVVTLATPDDVSATFVSAAS